MKTNLKTRIYVTAGAITTTVLATYALAAPFTNGN